MPAGDGAVRVPVHLGIVMGVQVDEPRRDPAAGGVDDLGPVGRLDPGGDAADDPVLDEHVGPAPVDRGSLRRAHRVRGVGEDYWATFVDPDPTNPKKRPVTVWGTGRVNVNTANAQTLLAVVCSGAPEATLCNDPIQMETFISSVTLAKTLLGGIPLFPTPRAFVRAMQGRGGSAVVSIFKALGLEPVTFRSPKEVQKGITTESKVFSIYADGVVVGRNRETRVRVHEVVDFRNAAELGATGGIGSGSTTSSTSTGSSGSTGRVGGTNAQDDLDSGAPTDADVLAALLSDHAGTVVYYRIE